MKTNAVPTIQLGLYNKGISEIVGNALIINTDCFEWMANATPNSIHAIVTDPPYGIKEYDTDQLEKRANGKGGIWRLPPSFDGHTRSPLPRFTALSKKEREKIREFFYEWSKLALRVLKPGGHVFIASNSFLSQLVFSALVDGGLEFRGQLIRLVQTLRGGDRPKNAEKEFPHVSSLLRGAHEPWGVLRKPLPAGMKVSECLREFETGGLRRAHTGNPFSDVIVSERTPKREKEIAGHPTLKPQSFLRTVVYKSLPLGRGVVLDPFMGSGSTLAAAEAVGVKSIGIEKNISFYEMSKLSIPKLSKIAIKNS